MPDIHPKTFAPLIELHGFLPDTAEKFLITIKNGLQKKLEKLDYDNLVFSIFETKVIDSTGAPRPFIRFISTEYRIVHEIVEYLLSIQWKGEVEFVKLNQFWDLR